MDNQKVKMEIVKPEEFGLEEKKALTIDQSFMPKVIERDGYMEVYKQILSEEISEDLVVRAKRLRLDLVKVRTGIASIHKTEKQYYWAAGKYVDAVKNKLTEPVTEMEKKLSEIENHYENLERERREKLASERLLKIQEFEGQEIPGLGDMEEEVFKNYLAGVKVNFEAKKEEERLDKLELNRYNQIKDYSQFYESDEFDLRNESDKEFSKYLELVICRKKEHDYKVAEAKRKQDIYLANKEKLSVYAKFTDLSQLTLETTEDAFNKMLSEAVKTEQEYEAEQEKIRLENERLRKESEEREKKAAAEKLKREEEEAKRKAKEDLLDKAGKVRQEMLFEIGVNLDFNSCREMTPDVWDDFYQKKNKEYQKEENRKALEKMKAKALEEKQRKEREAQEAQLKKALEEKERVEREFQAKRDKEAEAERKAQEEARKLELAPDKDKLNKWIEDMTVFVPSLQSEESQKVAEDIEYKFLSFKNWAKKEVEKLK